MAMPRLAGARSFTRSPPMKRPPAVMSSSPAMRRSSVDFPQPEGPTSTTNSPELISRSIPCSTGVAPKDLRTPEIAIDAIPFTPSPSSFDGAGGQALHQMPLNEEEEDADRKER